MKSTRLVLGALVVTLHLNNTIQCAASEPATPQYPDCNASVIFPEKSHAPLRNTGWKRVQRGPETSRWEQFTNIPQDQYSNAEFLTYLTQSPEKLSSDIADAIEHTSQLEYQIACAQSELARVTSEKTKMEAVAKRRLLHTFSAFNMSMGITKFDDQKSAVLLAKKIVDKNNERAIIERNLAQYLSGIVQKHTLQRTAAIEAYWEPTKEMSALSYGLYCATYGMGAPSAMTIDEALQTEFEYAGKEQVAKLITYTKRLWPTLQDALNTPAAIPHDVASQESTIQQLEEKISKANNDGQIGTLYRTLEAETKKLHALKLLRFFDLCNCEKSITTMSHQLTNLNQQIFALEQNAEIAKEKVQELLGVVLYDARARGLDVPTAIAQTLANIPGTHPKDTQDVIEFLTLLYEENKNPYDAELTTEKEPLQNAATPSETPQHFLTKVMTKKAENTKQLPKGKKGKYLSSNKMSDYARYLTHKLVTHNMSNDQVTLLEKCVASQSASRYEAVQSLCKLPNDTTIASDESSSSFEADEKSATNADEETQSEASENN